MFIKKNHSIIFSIKITACTLLLTGCMGAGDSTQPVTTFSPASCAAVGGLINTNAGASTGAQYVLTLGNGSINYSNINNTFYTSSNTNKIVDVGSTCLDSITTYPGGGVGAGSTISAIVGHAYIVEFKNLSNGTFSYTKFIVNSYQNGIIRISYVPNL